MFALQGPGFTMQRGGNVRRRGLAALAFAAGATVLAALVWSSWVSAGGNDQDHGISFTKNCTTPTVVGGQYTCSYRVINSVLVDTAGDALEFSGISDVVHAHPADVPSGPVLDQLTVAGTLGGASCEDSGGNPTTGGAGAVGSGTAPIAKCTLPSNSSITFNTFSFYTVDDSDPSPLNDTATLTWRDLCTGTSTNCSTGTQTTTAGGSSPLITNTPTNSPSSTPTDTPTSTLTNTPTNTSTNTPTRTPTRTATASPTPLLVTGTPTKEPGDPRGPSMALLVFANTAKTQLVCGTGALSRVCDVPVGATFSVDVKTDPAPAGGFQGYQIVLQHPAQLKFVDQPGLAENRWPPCGTRGYEQVTAQTVRAFARYTLGCKAGPPPRTYKGVLANVHFRCNSAGSGLLSLVGGGGAHVSFYERPSIFGNRIFLASDGKGGKAVADAVTIRCLAP